MLHVFINIWAKKSNRSVWIKEVVGKATVVPPSRRMRRSLKSASDSDISAELTWPTESRSGWGFVEDLVIGFGYFREALFNFFAIQNPIDAINFATMPHDWLKIVAKQLYDTKIEVAWLSHAISFTTYFALPAVEFHLYCQILALPTAAVWMKQ